MIRLFLVIALVTLPVLAVADEPVPAPVAEPAFEGAPPPPGMDEPGVPAAAAPQVDPETVALPMPDTRPVRDRASRTADKTRAEIEASSDSVNERTEGSDTIWEYRKDGKLRMVRVQPRGGREQIYVDGNGDGRLDRDSVEGPVSPVYFTLYEWN